MNTYRVDVRMLNWNRTRSYDVDASNPGTAIKRALEGLPLSPSLTVSCLLYRRDTRRDYGDHKVREVDAG